jgi:hypothetical protein
MGFSEREVGFTNSAEFVKIHRNSAGSVRSVIRNQRFLDSKFEIYENSNKF